MTFWVPLLVIETGSAPTALPLASVTVAVAREVLDPSAGIDDGLRATETCAAGPGVCVSVTVPDAAGLAEASVAVIVEVPATVEEVMVAV